MCLSIWKNMHTIINRVRERPLPTGLQIQKTKKGFQSWSSGKHLVYDNVNKPSDHTQNRNPSRLCSEDLSRPHCGPPLWTPTPPQAPFSPPGGDYDFLMSSARCEAWNHTFQRFNVLFLFLVPASSFHMLNVTMVTT